ncbi:MAG: FG-GAP-like repeat-containing protein [Planctomycetota bacterium]
MRSGSHILMIPGIELRLAMGALTLVFQLLCGTIDAQFLPTSPIPTPMGMTIGDCELGDIDGDGFEDLVAVNFHGEVSIAFSAGDGTHGNRISLAAADGFEGISRTIDAGDLDGDGDVDIAIGWAYPEGVGGFISILVNNGAGFDERREVALSTSENRTPFDLDVCDVNGDGREDIVCCTNILDVLPQPASVTILRSLGAVSGGGIAFTEPQHIESSSLAYNLLAHDMDGDGDLDLLMASRDGNTFSSYRNDGTGFFSLVTEIFFLLLPHPYSMVAGDFDGDGLEDVVLGTWMTKSLIFLQGDGDLDFVVGEEIPVGVFGWGLMQRIGTTDMDGDGTLDIVAPFSSGVVVTRYNNGNGSFDEESLFSSYQGPLKIRFADLDNNGTQDLLMDHSDLEVFTAFYGGFNVSGYFHFEPQRVSAGLPATIPLRVAANLGIEAFELGIDLDNTLLIPMSINPSASVMALTGAVGPETWIVDLGLGSSSGVSLVADLGLPPGDGLGAGIVQICADLEIEVAPVSTEIETFISPQNLVGGAASLRVTGGVLVEAATSGSYIRIEVPIPFIRGDANDNGQVNIADAVLVLRRLFGIDPAGDCEAAEDADGDGRRDLGDAIRVVTYLFSGGVAPVAPFPQCAIAPDPLILPCTERVSCP